MIRHAATFHQHRHGALSRHLRHEIMPVKTIPFQRYKKVPGPDLAGIRFHIPKNHVSRAITDFRRAGFGCKFQRAFFHGKIYFSKNVAVTTAVIVFCREVVSFWPSQLVVASCSGVI